MMATFELEKAGKTYEVEAPDQAAALAALPQIEASGIGKGASPERGVMDKLLGIGGERYQTFPERAVRGLAAIPGKLIDAAASAPAGSHEASAAMAGPAFETALATTPLSPAMRGAAAATGVAAPAVKDIEAASHGAYQELRGMGLQLEPKAVTDMAGNLAADLSKAGYRDYLAPKTFRAIEELKALKNPTYQDIEAVRQLLNRAGADPLEKDAVRRAIDGIDDFVGNLKQEQVIAGDPEKAASLSESARGDWSAKKRAETIEEALDKADRQAGSAHSGANTDNAIRQQIKAIRNNPKKSRGFTKDELDQMDAIIQGTTASNLLRAGGNMLGGGGGLGASLTAGAGAFLTAGAGGFGAAAPLVGYGLKQAGGASTRRQVEQLLEMIRRRSPTAKEQGAEAFPTPNKPEAETLAAPGRAAAGMLPDNPLAYQSPLGQNQL